jgi:PAS domain S-box-containing protein
MSEQPNSSVTDTRWSESTIDVLHVDDDRAFAEVSAEFLEREDDRLTVAVATSATEALDRLERIDPDCIVSDYDMPGPDGLEFLESVRETDPELPFILYTGKGSEEIASEAISAGVTDYLQKSPGRDQYRILRNRIVNSVATYRSQRSLEIFRAAAEHSGHSIYITDSDGVIEYVNPSFTDITGYTAEEAVGKTPAILKSGEHGSEFYAELWGTILDGDVWENEIVNRRKNGELYVANQTIAPVFIRDGDPERFVAVNQEITDRKRYRATLEKQCENLDVLNKILRYGIRDDLQTVTGYATLLGEHVDEEGQAYLDVLLDRAWDGVDRIEAARHFAELLHRPEPEDALVELQEVIARAVRDVRSRNDDVDIVVDEGVPSASIVADTVVESIVQLLVESIVQCSDETLQRITVSASESDDRVVVRAQEGTLERDGEFRELDPEDVLNLDVPGVSPSDLYLIRSFIDGYDGRMRIHEEGGRTGFAVEFPVDPGFVDAAGGVVKRAD